MTFFSPIVIERTDNRLVRHGSVGAARNEAERLARANPGKDFAVYVPLESVRLPEESLRVDKIAPDGEDIPF